MISAVASDVRRQLLLTGNGIDAQHVRAAASSAGYVVDDRAATALSAALTADLRGFGPLEPMVADASVTDIAVNGAGEVWVDRGSGMSRVSISFADESAVRRLAQRLATSVGRRLDDACPYVDASLPGGIRLHAILPPLVDRIAVSLRIPRHRAWSLADLTTSGMVAADAQRALAQLVAHRLAFLVTGGTGSGKTTLLNALLGEVATPERIVIVEDTCELAPVHPHVVRLQSRAANLEGAGGVSMRQLVRQTLRMRPDRLVVGEVRGAEVIDLLTAFNTGHRGGCGTVHANSAHDAIARLEALATLGGLAPQSLQRLAGSAVDAVVHLERDDLGARFVASIGLLTRGEGGRSGVDTLHVESALDFDRDGRVCHGPAHDRWLALVSGGSAA